MTDNLELWHRYGTTDPRHTKEVSYGRKFTAIDGYYQIMRATEAFGPFGTGWGWTSDEEVVVAVDQTGKAHTFAKVKLSLWYYHAGQDERCVAGPVIAMNMLLSKAGVPDEEAFKKATTDALTKALSYLGFSADVFMGKFDDVRYVADMKKKFEKADQEQAAKLPDDAAIAVSSIKAAVSVASLTNIWNSMKDSYEKLTPAQQSYVRLQFSMRKQALEAPSASV